MIDKSWRGCWKEIQGDGAAFAAAMVGNGWGWIEGVRYHPIGEAHRPRRKKRFHLSRRRPEGGTGKAAEATRGRRTGGRAVRSGKEGGSARNSWKQALPHSFDLSKGHET